MTIPYLIIGMGISGTGKSTLSKQLAKRLGLPFYEADDFHSPENKAWMASGKALTDDMRAPWIQSICDALSTDGQSCVLAYSGLRRAHRQKFRELGFRTLFIHLNGSKELIARRMRQRSGHFMPVELLNSQIASMEPALNEPDIVLVSIDDAIKNIVANAIQIVDDFVKA